jgi:hypothetical protein
MRAVEASAAARRFVHTVRVHIDAGASIDERLFQDVAVHLGLRPHGWRSYFESSDHVLDLINDMLVEECASRLRAAARRCEPLADQSEGLRALSVAIAKAIPIDRSAIVVRLERRLRAFRRPDEGPSAATAERLFVREAADAMHDMVRMIGRDFTWPAVLAVRAVFATYERALEAWILNGGSGMTFVDSPFIMQTLPSMLDQMTAVSAPSDALRVASGSTLA